MIALEQPSVCCASFDMRTPTSASRTNGSTSRPGSTNSTTPRATRSPARARRRGRSGPSPSSTKRQCPGCRASRSPAAAMTVAKSLWATMRAVITTVVGRGGTSAPAPARASPGAVLAQGPARRVEGVVHDPALGGSPPPRRAAPPGCSPRSASRPPWPRAAAAHAVAGRCRCGWCRRRWGCRARAHTGSAASDDIQSQECTTSGRQSHSRRQRSAAGRTSRRAARALTSTRCPCCLMTSTKGPPPIVHTRRSQRSGRYSVMSASCRSAPPLGSASFMSSTFTAGLTARAPAGGRSAASSRPAADSVTKE